ncbi:MAG: hypothetical protein NZM38_09880 [Cytophagales bacterium]|nr:hypothetical protein [Cytophagales bacterium]MDW8385065.1 hypothetical protein [Flammeovirgaceae bacterium]
MRKVRMGMIGGGISCFIVEIHRMAARLDSYIELLCGAFSEDSIKKIGLQTKVCAFLLIESMIHLKI